MWRKLMWAALGAECAVAVAFGGRLWLQHSRPVPAQAQSLVQSDVTHAGEAGDALVFVTRTGLWYHRATCREVRQSRIPIKLSQISQYRRPCAVCRPPH